jgi:hypothetical protein
MICLHFMAPPEAEFITKTRKLERAAQALAPREHEN